MEPTETDRPRLHLEYPEATMYELVERVADGFYFARSLKLIKHIFAHPEMLELPLGEDSGFTY